MGDPDLWWSGPVDFGEGFTVYSHTGGQVGLSWKRLGV
jgi:hypothetical protein